MGWVYTLKRMYLTYIFGLDSYMHDQLHGPSNVICHKTLLTIKHFIS